MSTGIQPLAYGRLLTTVSAQILPANPTRKGLMFFNASLVAIAVCPSMAVDTAGLLVPLAAGINGAGSLTLQPTGFVILDEFEPTSAWNGIAASGTDNALTVWEFS